MDCRPGDFGADVCCPAALVWPLIYMEIDVTVAMK